MLEVIERLKQDGYNLSSFAADGKIYRFGEGRKNRWYLAHQNYSRKTGQRFYVVVYGDWSTGEVHTYCSLEGKVDVEDRSEIKKQIEEAQRRNEKERKNEQEKVAVEVEAKWNALHPSGASAYLQRKGITGNLEVRFQGEDFYVPMRDVDGKLWSLQKIQPDGGKFFHPGGRVEGCFFVFGEFSETVYLCEGLATGYSISQATGKYTIVAFNANNLPKVAAALKAKYKNASFIVCGDDDQWTTDSKGEPTNPGRLKANEAAAKALGKAVFPKFESLDGKPTDFNDLHVREGLEKVKEQLSNVTTEKSFVVALGFRGKEYFFTSSSNRQISQVVGFSETDLYGLMPRAYWEAAYPSQRGGIDWSEAKSQLMLQARRKGIFEPKHVRGSGVWADSGRVVVNLGDSLVVDGSPVGLDSFSSRYFYTLGKRLPAIHPEPLTLEECQLFREVCSKFKWVNNEHGILLAGALITSKICGALPFRPHIWITGSAYTGKSTLLERLVHPVLEDRCLFLQGGTTEPGLRQAIGADAIPIIFDEFETTGRKSSDTVQSIVELMRSTWSEGSGAIAKGGSGGTASFYHPRFSGIVSSIRTNLTNDADKSRFAILELAPHGNDKGHWLELDAMLRMVDEEYISRLYARSIAMLPTLLANFKLIKSAFSQKVTTRFGDHYGMLLAGTSILLSDSVLTSDEVDTLVQGMEMPQERTQAKVADHHDCLTHLLTTKVRIEVGISTSEKTIGELIEAAKESTDVRRALQRYGVSAELDHLFVSGNGTEMRKLFASTRWHASWKETLLRVPGAEFIMQKKFAGSNQTAVKLPMISVE